MDEKFGHVPDDWRISAGHCEKGRQAEQCVEWPEALQKRFVFYQRVCVPEEMRTPWKLPVDASRCRVNEFADLTTTELLSVPRLCHRHETVHVLHCSSCRVKQVILIACTFASWFSPVDPPSTHAQLHLHMPTAQPQEHSEHRLLGRAKNSLFFFLFIFYRYRFSSRSKIFLNRYRFGLRWIFYRYRFGLSRH